MDISLNNSLSKLEEKLDKINEQLEIINSITPHYKVLSLP